MAFDSPFPERLRQRREALQITQRELARMLLVAVKPAGCARPRILGASMLALAAVPLETRDEGAVMRDGPNAFEDVFARMQV